MLTAENKLRLGQARGDFSENDRQQRLLDDIRSMTATLEQNKGGLAKKMEDLKARVHQHQHPQ